MEQLGDYRLLEELAQGTTGRVFAAGRWPALGGRHLMAVKVLSDEVARNERYLMLLREGVARFSSFEHPGIVPVLEVTTASDHLLMASELVDGQPADRLLRYWTDHEVRVDPLMALWIIQRVASILTAAHGSGLVHGHLAPDQILVTYDGEIRLLGLGRGEARGVLPLQDVRRPFLAPEVLRTGVASPASDVHGLARVLHHALAGANSVLSTPGVDAPAWLPPLRSYGVAIHPALEGMVDGMLAASPKARPSLEDVEAALAATVSARGPILRNQLARLIQTSFTTQLAGAKMRRQRANRGPDAVEFSDDFFVPRLPSRTLSEGPGSDDLADNRRGAPGDPAGFGGRRPGDGPRASATSYGWTETASLQDLSPTDTFDGIEQALSEAGLSEVRAADPRLKALESGDDEELMALVDAIVKHSTPPRGVEVGTDHLLLDDDDDALTEPRVFAVDAPAAEGAGPSGDGSSRPVRDYGFREHASAPADVVYADYAFIENDDAVYGTNHDGLPLPEPLPPDAIFGEDVPRLPIGTVIGERYRIEGVIGEGGVSVVYRGSHSFLRKEVAIKVLRPELATMPPVVERFHREARSVAQLDHPNIVRVIDFGKSSTGSLFLIMDLIEGVSLAEQLEREGWFAPTSAVRVAVSILTGLEHAHGRGVIHRDLKPDNIMIQTGESGQAEVKILDFGIAKLGDVEIGSRPITEAGMVFGTPRYMSPEQAAGEPVDHRSDLFTVGIILYQLLSGQLPFDGDTTVQILRRVLTQPAPRLRVNGLPSATSEALADVVSRALAKSPEERFPSARGMREALQACFPL